MKIPLPSCLFLLLAAPFAGAATAPDNVAPATNAASPPHTAASSPTQLPATNSQLLNSSSQLPALAPRDLPEIHARILLPKDWTLIPGKLLEGDVLLATREKIATENDPWTTGLSMTIDRNGAKDSGQKASDYALSLAHEANEKAGDEATPLKESQSGPFHEVRFDFSVPGDQPLAVTEVLRANNATGTLAVILWQNPKEEATKLKELKESILAGLQLNPAQ
jgi:hypothetical protein